MSKLSSLTGIGVQANCYGVFDPLKNQNLKNAHDFNYKVFLGGSTIVDSDKKGSVHKEWIPDEKIKV